MRVIYPHPREFPNREANSIQIINTCWSLANRGIEVIFMISKLGKKTVKECLDFYGLTEHPNLHIKGSTKKMGRKKFNLFVIRETWKYKGDRDTILFFRDRKLAKLFILLRWFLRIPCVVEAHAPRYKTLSEKFGQEKEELNLPEKSYRMFKIWQQKNTEKFLYKNTNGLICQTRGIKETICKDFSVCAFIEVIPSAARLTNKKFEKDADKILYLGHLYLQKGVDILVKALKYLPNRKLIIVGGNKKSDIERVRKISSDLEVDNQIVFAGCVPHSKVEKYFKGMGVAVIPIINTVGRRLFTSPMKLFEYMAANIPIVASDLPSMREILENGNTAVLVEPENPEALAGGIQKVLEDRKFAQKIAENAYKKVKEYTWENRAKKIAEFLEDIIKR